MAVHNKLHDSTTTKVDDLRDTAAEMIERSGVRQEADRLAQAIRGLGVDGMAEVKKLLGDRLPELDVKKGWNSVEERLSDELTAHPLRTVGVAALAGLALGLILRR